MAMSLAKFGTKNDCAGEDQQQFAEPERKVGDLFFPELVFYIYHIK
jgi:hypothetical protein